MTVAIAAIRRSAERVRAAGMPVTLTHLASEMNVPVETIKRYTHGCIWLREEIQLVDGSRLPQKKSRSIYYLLRMAQKIHDAGVVVTVKRVAFVCGMEQLAVKNAFIRCDPEHMKGFTLVSKREHKHMLTLVRLHRLIDTHEKSDGRLTMTMLARGIGFERASFHRYVERQPGLREKIRKAGA